jgi:peptide/nickel transport system substrate-binding protein
MFFSLLAGSQSAPLKSLQVRQAMNYALNRPALAKAFGGIPSSEMLTEDGYSKKYANYYPYNPTKAKQLLAAAGYPNGFTMDAVSFASQGSFGTPLAQGVAAQLAKVGITVNVEPSPPAQAFTPGHMTPLFECPCGGDYSSVYYAIFFGVDLPPLGYSGFSDPVFNRLLAKADAAPVSQSATDRKRTSCQRSFSLLIGRITATRSVT